jgi:hypothetical protein
MMCCFVVGVIGVVLVVCLGLYNDESVFELCAVLTRCDFENVYHEDGEVVINTLVLIDVIPFLLSNVIMGSIDKNPMETNGAAPAYHSSNR